MKSRITALKQNAGTRMYSLMLCAAIGCTDGETPHALVQYTDGSFYRTTAESGFTAKDCGSNFGCGTLFNLTTGLGPFVRTLPDPDAAGAQVRILGSNLMGATRVNFKPRAPSQWHSALSPSPPFSATSGQATAITPRGTLSSNVAFQVN